MGDGPSNPEGNTSRSVKPWGEAMYQVARSELAKAADDPDYLDPDREAYMRAGVEGYESKRRGRIEGVLQRLDDSIEVGDEQGVKDLRDWLDGKNKDGVSNAKPTEILDILRSKKQQPEQVASTLSAVADPNKEVSSDTRQLMQQVARKGLVFPGPPPSKR